MDIPQERLEDMVISRKDDLNLPAWTCYLNTLDLYLWYFLKSQVIPNITIAIAQIQPDLSLKHSPFDIMPTWEALEDIWTMLHSVHNAIHGSFKLKIIFVNIEHTACLIQFPYRHTVIEKLLDSEMFYHYYIISSLPKIFKEVKFLQ